MYHTLISLIFRKEMNKGQPLHSCLSLSFAILNLQHFHMHVDIFKQPVSLYIGGHCKLIFPSLCKYRSKATQMHNEIADDALLASFV